MGIVYVMFLTTTSKKLYFYLNEVKIYIDIIQAYYYYLAVELAVILFNYYIDY